MWLFRLFIVIFLPSLLFAQQPNSFSHNLGNPFIQNFQKSIYKGGLQNWGFTQDEVGNIYVANNEGMLQFDGKEWLIYPLPNKTIVRSITFDSTTQRVYVGGQDEFGYFNKSISGFWEYQSLKSKIPKPYQEFGDVWQVVNVIGEGIYFRTGNRIYHWHQGEIQVYTTPPFEVFIGEAFGKLYTVNSNGGVAPLNSKATITIPTGVTTGLLSIGEDSLIIATEKKGIFLHQKGVGLKVLNADLQLILKQMEVLTITSLDCDKIAIGTSLGGLIITDLSGKPLNIINKKSGLQNNRIRALLEDKDGNLWLGLDYGIDLLELAQPYRIIIPDGELEGTTYDIKIFDGKMYVGTSNGLFARPWSSYLPPTQTNHGFYAIPNTNGQVWGLSVINDKLLMGHHNGAFQILENNVQKISPDGGYWKFVNLEADKDQIIGGNYTGVSFFNRNSTDQLSFQGKVESFVESSRFLIATAENEFWISHPYRGIYKMITSEDKTKYFEYGKQKGLPSKQENHIFLIRNDIFVCAEKGIFLYNREQDKFMPYQPLNDILGEQTKTRRLFEDKKGNIWYITEDKIGFLEIQMRGLDQTISNHFIRGIHESLVGGFEYIYPYDEENVFIGAEKGLIHLNPKAYKATQYTFKTQISKIFLMQQKDSLIFMNQTSVQKEKTGQVSLSHKENSLRFDFSTTNFSKFIHPYFQYKLEGFDEEWSSWTELMTRSYTNLLPGRYTFMVKSGLPGSYESEPVYFTFLIESPWYANPFAYAFYFFLAFGTVVGLIWIPKKQFEKEKAQIEKESIKKVAVHRAEAKQSKEALVALKNEKLQAEIEHKNRELATKTIHLLQKNELMEKIKAGLTQIGKEKNQQKAHREIDSIIQLIDKETQQDKEWEQFFLYFDQVHDQFFKRLKKEYPILTPKDQKLCAFLKMNLSSKEIAPLMNISTRGVEISRYRLRKKLELDSNINLNEFMMEF